MSPFQSLFLNPVKVSNSHHHNLSKGGDSFGNYSSFEISSTTTSYDETSSVSSSSNTSSNEDSLMFNKDGRSSIIFLIVYISVLTLAVLTVLITTLKKCRRLNNHQCNCQQDSTRITLSSFWEYSGINTYLMVSRPGHLR